MGKYIKGRTHTPIWAVSRLDDTARGTSMCTMGAGLTWDVAVRYVDLKYYLEHGYIVEHEIIRKGETSEWILRASNGDSVIFVLNICALMHTEL